MKKMFNISSDQANANENYTEFHLALFRMAVIENTEVIYASDKKNMSTLLAGM